MTLQIITPEPINLANITASNVSLEPAWGAGSYNLGTTVRHDNELWTPKANGTTSEPSHTLNDDWQYLGPINKLAAFDLQTGVNKRRVTDTYSVHANALEFSLEGLGVSTAIAFDGVDCTDLTVVATDTVSGDVLDYSYTMQDRQPRNGSPWRFIHLPPRLEASHVVRDIVIPANTTIDVTLNRPGANARAGSIVIGLLSEHGTILGDAGVSNNSQSTFKRDLDRITMVSRPPSKRFTFDILSESGDFALLEALEKHVSEAAYFMCDARSYFRGYAKVNDYRLVASSAGYDTYNVELVTL